MELSSEFQRPIKNISVSHQNSTVSKNTNNQKQQKRTLSKLNGLSRDHVQREEELQISTPAKMRRQSRKTKTKSKQEL